MGAALAFVAPAVAAVALLADADLVEIADGVRLALAAAFSLAGSAMLARPPTRRLAFVTLAGLAVAEMEFVASAYARRSADAPVADAVASLAAPLVVAIALHLLLVLPEGRPAAATGRAALGCGYGVAVVVGFVRWGQQPRPAVWPLALFAVAAGVTGLAIANGRYQRSRGVDRNRMQWLGLAIALCAEVAVIVAALRLLLDWPPHAAEAVAASLVLVAAALAAGASPNLVGRVDRLLSHAVSVAGLSAVVTLVYLAVVVGLGRVPTDDERMILVLSMVAAGVSALVYLPTRARLDELAQRLVYGAGRDPSRALETFGTRLTRALPLDELLLQLAEACNEHFALRSTEVWTGVAGRLTRSASVPDRGAGHVELGPAELPIVTRTRVSGRSWAEVWTPGLLEERPAGRLRVVPMAHQGELFGVIVLERHSDDDDFDADDEHVLAELARQVALALHNSELDNALRETLDEVRRKNAELQRSRARIVAAADLERRKIERNLHDGAQQRLVALAVKLRLIQRIGEGDPAQALAMVDEARDEALATVDELRALAHGIYPPVLMDRGLPDALAAAAGRAAIPTDVSVKSVGRYSQEVEAAVYFCCLEALQNAGKHAGDGASAEIHVEHVGGELRFFVSDDGVGFDVAERGGGHGFVNMTDRIGALGGEIDVGSAPGAGTRVSGCIPVP